MSIYENLVMQTQMNYSRYYGMYMAGKSPYKNSNKVIPYKEQIHIFAKQIQNAECIIVGGASGLSASGGGNFYYEDNESYRKYFKPFADKYHFKGAFAGMQYDFDTPNERWGYLTTFLHTTQTAPVRKPYIDLDAILNGKDFHILTTNQDTQFVKLYPEEKVSEIQGDHRFFQCSRQCCDDTWDAVEPVKKMYEAMTDGTFVPDELIPHCPHCGAEAFPWVRGYGNFLQGRKYDHEYQKMSKYLEKNKNKRLLFIELGVGRMTPMFIQEPFWHLTGTLPDAYYVSVNDKYNLLPKEIEEKGIVIVDDIAKVLGDVRAVLGRRLRMNDYYEIAQKIKDADAILIGASNGLSITEGLNLFADDEAFENLFKDYKEKYGFRKILDGFFFRWNKQEEKWGFFSRLVNHYSGNYTTSSVMEDLKTIVGDKPYFILTSNGEGHFEMSGFEPQRVYELEGNWIELRCSRLCHDKTYPALPIIRKLAEVEKNGLVSSEFLPKCPVCGAAMDLYNAQPPKQEVQMEWEKFCKDFHNKKIVILELGIGWRNQLIKAPLMRMTANEPHATYITINLGEVYIPDNIKDTSYGLDGYLSDHLNKIKQAMVAK